MKLVRGEEALLSMSERHLECRVAVGVDPVLNLVRVTTAVELLGWRGRLYFAPVSLLHPLVVRALLIHTARTLSPIQTAGLPSSLG